MHRRRPARRDGGLSNGVRQTKDTYSGGCRTLVSALPDGWRAEKGWNMPALREISLEYERQIASVEGLQPSKVIGARMLRFCKGTSDKIQVMTWADLVRTGSSGRL